MILNENAHKGAINCLRVSDRVNDNINVITGGEDGLVKIWDTSITLLQVIDVRNIPEIIKDFKNQHAYGIQSLDLYCCEKENPRKLLLGLRCGEVLEATINDKEDKVQKHVLAKQLEQATGIKQARDAMLDFQFYTYVSSHSSLYLS